MEVVLEHLQNVRIVTKYSIVLANLLHQMEVQQEEIQLQVKYNNLPGVPETRPNGSTTGCDSKSGRSLLWPYLMLLD